MRLSGWGWDAPQGARALAAGKAVVASSLAAEGIAARADEHFLLADDDDELVEALIALLRNPERRVALGRDARVWAEQKPGLGRPIASFEQLYETVIAARQRRVSLETSGPT